MKILLPATLTVIFGLLIGIPQLGSTQGQQKIVKKGTDIEPFANPFGYQIKVQGKGVTAHYTSDHHSFDSSGLKEEAQEMACEEASEKAEAIIASLTCPDGSPPSVSISGPCTAIGRPTCEAHEKDHSGYSHTHLVVCEAESSLTINVKCF